MGLTFLQAASSTANETVYTFAAQNLGTAAADRYIICGAVSRNASDPTTINSISIGGVAATLVKKQDSGNNIAGIYIALVPTGATGDVVVTMNNGCARCGIGLWAATALKSATAEDNGSSTASAPTYDIDVSAGGFIIGVGTSQAASAAWTNLTEKYDNYVESQICSTGASDTFSVAQVNRTITVTFATASDQTGVFASWGIKSVGGSILKWFF